MICENDLFEIGKMFEFLNRWGPTLRDIDAHPEKYSEPKTKKRGRPVAEINSLTK